MPIKQKEKLKPLEIQLDEQMQGNLPPPIKAISRFFYIDGNFYFLVEDVKRCLDE
jgi:hypothetical protein